MPLLAVACTAMTDQNSGPGDEEAGDGDEEGQTQYGGTDDDIDAGEQTDRAMEDAENDEGG